MVSQGYQSNENVSPSWHDLLGFIGFNHEQQHIVIGKKLDFIYKIAHRTIADIHHVGNIKLLEDLWCNTHCFLTNTNSLTR
jgi:hypothetical protein